MARLSITEAWNETAEFVKRDFGPLFAIALALIAFPNIAMQALAPAAPGAVASPAVWLLLLLVVLALTIVGSLAITALVLGRETIVGRAIGHGFRRAPSMIGASLIVGVVAIIVLTTIVLLLGIVVEGLRSGNPAAFAGFAKAMALFVLLFLPLWVRLMMMTPVASGENAGPVAIVTRSWALTRGHFWKLLGLALLLALVVVVIALAVSSVFGVLVTLAAGRPQPGSLSALLLLIVNGVVNAAVTVFFTALIARIYVQLSGGATSGS